MEIGLEKEAANPQVSDASLSRAAWLAENGENQQALDMLAALPEDPGGDGQKEFLMGRIFLSQNDTKNGNLYMAKARLKGFDPLAIAFEHAGFLYSAGLTAMANALVSDIAKQMPDPAVNAISKGTDLFEQGMFREAAEFCQNAAAVYPSQSAPLYILSFGSYLALEDGPRAEQVLAAFDLENQQMAGASLYQHALLLHRQDRYQELLAYLESHPLEEAPLPEVITYKASALMKMGRKEEAVASLLSQLNLGSKAQVQLLQSNHAYIEAVSLCDRMLASALPPESFADITYLKAKSFLKVGNKAQGEAMLKELIAFCRQKLFQEGYQENWYLQRIVCHTALCEYSQAEELLDFVLLHNPDSQSLLAYKKYLGSLKAKTR